MPLQVFPECWSRWGSVITDLAASFQFPAYDLEALTGCLSVFHGPGSTFRFETEFFKVVFDAVRQDDLIIDLAAVTVISKHSDNNRVRTGWVIAPPCPIHHEPKQRPGQNNTSADTTRPVWHKVTEGGRRTTYCCDEECKGPFKRGGWKIFDNARQRIVKKVLEHETIKLRQRLEQAEPPRQGSDRAQELSSQRLERNEAAAEEILRSNSRIKELEEECRFLKEEGNKLRQTKETIHRQLRFEAHARKRQIQETAQITRDKNAMKEQLRQAAKEKQALQDQLRLAQTSEDMRKRELEMVQSSLSVISTSLNLPKGIQGRSPETGGNANGQPGDESRPLESVSESLGPHQQLTKTQPKGKKTPNKQQKSSPASEQKSENVKGKRRKRKMRGQQSGIQGSRQQNQQQHGPSDAPPNKRRRLAQEKSANESHPIVIE